jgi:hypothetical protein
MKIRALLTGVALGAIAVIGITTGGAQARGVNLFIDTGDYWSHHSRDYCYYHDCGDSWYFRHHRHRWHERDWWMTGDHHGGNWNHDNHWRDHDHHDHDGDNYNNDDGDHHHHHD